jgi:predicted dehydrogenase
MAVAPADPEHARESPRVGVIGARKSRQGVGDHLARFFEAEGARVVAVCGTSAATAAEAAASLAERFGIRATAYASAAEMVEREPLDVLVVASPPATHVGYLDLALSAGLHVLCEKPLAWGGDFPGETARVVEAFARAGRHLAANEQWPHAVPAWRSLFPDVEPSAARSFQMLLCPRSPDPVAMVADAMPHALSVLHALHPGVVEPLHDVRVTPARSKGVSVHARRLDVEFAFPAPHDFVSCWVRLVPWPDPPRPAAFAFDGFLARRAIREPGYRMALRAEAGGGREVEMPDPMRALVRDFVARVRAGAPFPSNAGLVAAASHLKSVVEAASGAMAGSATGG